MTIHAATILQVGAFFGTLSGLAYYGVCLFSAFSFRTRKPSTRRETTPPPVSILKPLKGTDPEIYESFRSHCVQTYPEYELIFGVNDPSDPVVPLVRDLQSEFPQRRIELVLCRDTLGANTKVSNLAQMLKTARSDHLIVNDSDIRVPHDYLQRVIDPLQDPEVGMVTCLYRGIPAASFGSRLESVGISSDFAPAVLTAQQLEGGLRFAMGSTLAFRRADLEAVGGFESVADYLADDYELGQRIFALGRRIELSTLVVETVLPRYTFRRFFAHQLRWARTIRDSRRWGYVGMVLTFGLPWSLFALWSSQGALWGWILLALTALARLTVAIAVGFFVLRDKHLLRLAWLIPLRDVIAVLIWVSSFAGHKIAWRGEHFELRNGRLARI